jgi:sulfate permease, SulP family
MMVAFSRFIHKLMPNFSRAVQALFPFLNWPRLTLPLAKSEAQAGLTVAWIIVPQGIAYALLAGMPPITGIYMAIVPALVAVMWGASRTLATGPAAITSVLVGASVLGMGTSAAPQSEQWVQMVVVLALLSGVMQWLLGAFRLGWFISLVSSPVMTGFTQAAAILIIASQLPSLLGIAQLSQMSSFNPWAAAFGVSALGLLLFARRLPVRIPWVLIIIAATALASFMFNYSSHGAVVGALTVSFPAIGLPVNTSWQQIESLLLPAFVIAVVSFLEVASSSKAEHQRFGTRSNDNQDLIGQGLAKISSGLLGAAPSSASFSRSALNLYAGACSPWSTLFMVMFALLLLVLGKNALAIVPKAVLAAVVIAAVSSLIKPSAMVSLWRSTRTETVIAGLTFVTTIATAPALYWGVLLGVVVSLGHFLYQRLHPRMIEVGLHADGSLRDRILWLLPPLGQRVYAMRMDAALDFASAANFERQVFDALAARPDVQHICIFAQPINWIDATGTQVLVNMHTQLQTKGVTLHLSGLKLPLEQAFERSGVLQAGTYLKRYRSEAETIAALRVL